jgi:hypothetical protein
VSLQPSRRIERIIGIPLTLAFLFGAWLLKLWYDTAGPEHETFWAWLFWPVAAASIFVLARTIFVWLPATGQSAVVLYPWQLTALHAVCFIVCACSAVVFGRVLLFIRAENWYFENAWAFTSAPAVLFFATPILTFVGAAAIWPSEAKLGLRHILIPIFGFIAIYVLVQVWRFLTYAACTWCSGPAL